MSIFPTTRLHYAASDGCALLIREAIDKMDDETFQLYLKYHYATCERKDLTGITSHAIDIFQKQTTPPKNKPQNKPIPIKNTPSEQYLSLPWRGRTSKRQKSSG